MKLILIQLKKKKIIKKLGKNPRKQLLDFQLFFENSLCVVLLS